MNVDYKLIGERIKKARKPKTHEHESPEACPFGFGASGICYPL